MTLRRTLLAALAFGGALSAPALADEPGPGGERPPRPKDSRELYVFYCQACHMEGGKGAEGAAVYPALTSNARLGSTAYTINIIAKGRGGMPWFSDILTPAQTADLVNYLRSNFGNSYPDKVTAADVQPFHKPPARER